MGELRTQHLGSVLCKNLHIYLFTLESFGPDGGYQLECLNYWQFVLIERLSAIKIDVLRVLSP